MYNWLLSRDEEEAFGRAKKNQIAQKIEGSINSRHGKNLWIPLFKESIHLLQFSDITQFDK